MAYKAIPLETRSCKGCGVEFQTTDPRKMFHKPSCYSKTIKVTNAWLLANRPNFPTEPCRNCGGPVVQYRTRRYDGEMRYCQRSCQPRPKRTWHGPTKAELISSKSWLGRCKWCKKALRSGVESCKQCSDKRSLILLRLRTRLRWLLPKQCLQCGHMFNRFDQGFSCNPCKQYATKQSKQLRRLRKRGAGAYEPGIDYRSLYALAEGSCAICQQPCSDPSVWSDWDGLTWMPKAPTVDHIIPLASGGTHTWGNVQLACAACNSAKGDRLDPRGMRNLHKNRQPIPSAEFVNLLYGVGSTNG
jgi:5-methylcytosine-specific restriction endonuclease McrA